jgi:hypothetical protein
MMGHKKTPVAFASTTGVPWNSRRCLLNRNPPKDFAGELRQTETLNRITILRQVSGRTITV